MTRVLFLSKGEDSPSTSYRALQFFPALRDAGFIPSHVTLAGNFRQYVRALREAGRSDIVVVLRKTLPTPLLWALRQRARRLVFDLDDAIFVNSDGSPSTTRMRRFAAMARACDHVLAGNGFLARHAATYCRSVTIVPTCIDITRYATPAAKPDDQLHLVWIGSRSTRKYLVDALPALREATARVPNLRLKIIADFDLPDAGIETIPIQWSAASEASDLASAHIGIAPMADNDWTRGKCALKVLQYMAARLPVISSRAGVNAEVVEDGITGYLADSHGLFADRIAELAASPSLRASLGQRGRERVETTFAVTPVFETLRGALSGLA